MTLQGASSGDPASHGLCLLKSCVEEPRLSIFYRSLQGAHYLDFKFTQITPSWAVILDIRCIGLFHVGPVLFPDEGMFWQASALFDLFSFLFLRKALQQAHYLWLFLNIRY